MLMSLQRELQAAEELVDARPTDAAQLLRGVIFGHQPNDADSLKIKEQALDDLVAVLVKQQDAVALRSLLADLRPLFSAVPKAKTAKIVRLVIDSIATISRSAQILVRCLATSCKGPVSCEASSAVALPPPLCSVRSWRCARNRPLGRPQKSVRSYGSASTFV